MSTLAVGEPPVHIPSAFYVALILAIVMLFWVVRALRPVAAEMFRLIQIVAQMALVTMLLIGVVAVLIASLMVR